MKAYLVTISVTTRVVVDTDDIDSDEIIEAAEPRLRDAVGEGIDSFVENVVEDTECPYNPENDD